MKDESHAEVVAHEHYEAIPTRDISVKPRAFSTLLALWLTACWRTIRQL